MYSLGLALAPWSSCSVLMLPKPRGKCQARLGWVSRWFSQPLVVGTSKFPVFFNQDHQAPYWNLGHDDVIWYDATKIRHFRQQIIGCINMGTLVTTFRLLGPARLEAHVSLRWWFSPEMVLDDSADFICAICQVTCNAAMMWFVELEIRPES